MEQNGATVGLLPSQVFVSELVGTALLLLVGLSLVILMFGEGSPIAEILPSEGIRRLITGFLFGTTGALIALSPDHFDRDRDRLFRRMRGAKPIIG
jgi:hypothetical protein